MIKAYHAGYIKYDSEHFKRKGDYCILEISIGQMPNIQLLVIGKDGLISAHWLDTITEITGYHRYSALNGQHLGAGNLTPLATNSPKGMLEGLAEQLGFQYSIIANAYGKGIIELSNEL